MEWAWLEDFLTLVECGGFSRAAERRHVTQPAFSRRIRALERWAGAELIDRSSQRAGLTAAGIAFRPAAEEAHRRLLEGRDLAHHAGRETTGGVRLACTHMLASTYFGRWLAEVEPRLGQGVAIQLQVDHMMGCEHMMRRGEARLLLCHHHDSAPAELDARAFARIALGKDRLVSVSTPDDRGRPAHPLPARDGQTTRYLAYREESGLGRILRQSGVMDRLRGRLDTVFSSHAALTLSNLARDGRGLAWAPLSLVRADLKEGTLVQADEADGGAGMGVEIDVCLIKPVARQSPAVESLWLMARDHSFEVGH